MKDELGILFMPHRMLVLQRRLKAVERVLPIATPVEHDFAHSGLRTQLLALIVATKAGVCAAAGVLARQDRRSAVSADPSVTPPEVPMSHLFLLDLKIGR